VWLAGPATAAKVPVAAMNKTITISFVATGNAKDAGGQTHTFSTAITHIVYVSSAGRLFMSTSPPNRSISVSLRTGHWSWRGLGWFLLGGMIYGILHGDFISLLLLLCFFVALAIVLGFTHWLYKRISGKVD
jgi:hypothetical protein